MTEIETFIKELEKKDNVISNYFGNKELLISSLRELDNVIGMRKIKSQIIFLIIMISLVIMISCVRSTKLNKRLATKK